MKRSWPASVLDALQRLVARNRTDVFTRQQLIQEELPRIIADTQTVGLTPKYTLSKELQQLRDAGILEFLGPGRYRLLRHIVDAETFEGTDPEIDSAINDGRLRIGRVEASDEYAIQKRRRGQQRLRKLALDYYSRQCALCDAKEEAFLVTSHIARWTDSEDGRGDLRNVIILCRPHDSLFEFGYWSLKNDLTIIRRTVGDEPWVVDALLPQQLSFRAPSSHLPANIFFRVASIQM